MAKTPAIWSPFWFRILTRFTSEPPNCPAMSAGYIIGSKPPTASPIGFIAKLRAPTQKFAFFDRKTGYAAANKVHLPAQKVSSLPSNRIDVIFQAVDHTFSGGAWSKPK